MISSLCKEETLPADFSTRLAEYTRRGYRVIALAQREMALSYAKLQRVDRLVSYQGKSWIERFRPCRGSEVELRHVILTASVCSPLWCQSLLPVKLMFINYHQTVLQRLLRAYMMSMQCSPTVTNMQCVSLYAVIVALQ